MGSSEGFGLAEKMLNTASKQRHGCFYVMFICTLHGCHLQKTNYIIRATWQIYQISTSSNKRNAFTLPSYLIQSYDVYVFERLSGMKFSITRSLDTVPEQ